MSKIDISKCKYYQMAHCPENYICKYSCCDCYYKQLQELKADNERLNKLLKTYSDDYNTSTFKLGEMVLKNGNLYEEKQECLRLIGDYLKCLDEISEICKENKKSKIYNPDIDIVLQKIKEVKGNE